MYSAEERHQRYLKYKKNILKGTKIYYQKNKNKISEKNKQKYRNKNQLPDFRYKIYKGDEVYFFNSVRALALFLDINNYKARLLIINNYMKNGWKVSKCKIN